MKTKYIQLAELLFEMELERLSNEAEFHFEFNSWLDKFGNNCVSYVDDFRANQEDVLKLSKMLKEDFELGFWVEQEDGLYDYEMPTHYGDFITDCLEKQLAILTSVGYQLEIEYN